MTKHTKPRKKIKDTGDRNLTLAKFSRKECENCGIWHPAFRLKCPHCGIRNEDYKNNAYIPPYSVKNRIDID